MKTYFLKTNDYNAVVFEQNGKCKIMCCEPSGLFDEVIDIYEPSAIENLKKYFAETELNNYEDITQDEIDFSDIGENVNIDFICEC